MRTPEGRLDSRIRAQTLTSGSFIRIDRLTELIMLRLPFVHISGGQLPPILLANWRTIYIIHRQGSAPLSSSAKSTGNHIIRIGPAHASHLPKRILKLTGITGVTSGCWFFRNYLTRHHLEQAALKLFDMRINFNQKYGFNWITWCFNFFA